MIRLVYRGELEIHVTVGSWEADRLDAFALERGVKVSHIELDHGTSRAQPMLTVELSGTLEDAQARAEELCSDLVAARLRPVRVKIETAPWNDDVPARDGDARVGLYFEHHVKLRLPMDDVGRRIAASLLARAHDARLSRNARRQREDGSQERFVTQRCFGVGRTTSRARLDGLLAALDAGGFEVLEVEEEYVVVDDNLGLDAGWMDAPRTSSDREAPSVLPSAMEWTDQRVQAQFADDPEEFPATFVPLAVGNGVVQHAVFEPAHKHLMNAYKPGHPAFTNPEDADAWALARARVQAHLLRTISTTPWAGQLVMRGSATLPIWLGETARTPGDIDFVVVPATTKASDPAAGKLLDGIVAALAADPTPGLRVQDAAREDIWAYERAEGRRIVIPYDVADGLPGGLVQMDFVFGEEMPAAPVRATLPDVGTEILVAPPDLQLAWKILWLVTDFYPQGKDLYDAVALTGVVDLSRELLDRVFATAENPWDADRLTGFTAGTVLELDVDWGNFRAEHPGLDGDVREMLELLALAVDGA